MRGSDSIFTEFGQNSAGLEEGCVVGGDDTSSFFKRLQQARQSVALTLRPAASEKLQSHHRTRKSEWPACAGFELFPLGGGAEKPDPYVGIEKDLHRRR